MQAVVLAGGYATRLWPVTRNRPKMLLPIGETTVIDRVLAELEADDRIEDVYVSTNERFAEDFLDHIEGTDFEKPTLSVEETVEEDEKFGVVGALAQLVDREGLAGDDLLVVAGDNLISFDVSEFLDTFAEKDAPTLAAYDVGSRERAKAYGLINVDGEHVVDFQEKPADPDSTLVSIACYAFPAADVRFEEYLADDNNPDEPGWFIEWLVDHSDVYAFTFDDAWFDIGTPESYLDAIGWALDGESVVADSATVENTEIGENVHVLPGAEIVDSTVEDSIVFADATVRDCELRNSIIDRETHVENLDLAGALIGAHTEITNGG
ncbi:Glucose-1-phosphate thymidylyltransferase protein [Halorhabdus tiamatea SARL4B]|uniref:Glucose-1-phosphate thymidylyltransferase n=1 Tax=Halorhabdus tiamatea SARL4B TaxID=1033806 RepID=F7PLZ5_9EURY|nr:NDP-sugar synthase [Halorhabdus tiamatea]ERJ06395.1 Glucose-1-phosphate thymidylyltransferase protein [Halorhabdus tiamatea SARL4B]CCQ34564.1 glucose-1-phosphate thymidylyltransferase [Halorhabdus tiamatea SARL4B]